MARRYWLMKSSPSSYSIEDLERDGTTSWDGVRNYQARNLMRDEMKVGDLVLFHHSSAKPPGVAGIARVSRLAYPDDSAWDPDSPYFDARSTPEKPVWLMVDLEFVEKFAEVVFMDELRETAGLETMAVLQRGQRVSVLRSTRREHEIVRRLGRKKG